jgi:hypothetical protein
MNFKLVTRLVELAGPREESQREQSPYPGRVLDFAANELPPIYATRPLCRSCLLVPDNISRSALWHRTEQRVPAILFSAEPLDGRNDLPPVRMSFGALGHPVRLRNRPCGPGPRVARSSQQGDAARVQGRATLIHRF